MTPVVVLLHGLARGHGSMDRLAAHLRGEGFETWARTYPSRQHGIAELAAQITTWLVDELGDRPLCAVTHSMGGIIVRHLQDPRLRWQRIAMLAPPNNGSQLARSLAANPLFRWWYGPAGAALADGSQWPAPPAPFAVIAGTRSLALSNPTSWTLGRTFAAGTANDGTVAVAETQLPGMEAFAEVDATHTWIMDDPRVQRAVAGYLATGQLTLT